MALLDDIIGGVASFIPGGTAIYSAGKALIDGIIGESDPEEQKQYHSKYEGTIASEIAKLNDDKPSAQYQAARADNTRAYERTVERIGNAPGVGGNAAVSAALEEKAGRTLGDNNAKASAYENDRQESNKQKAVGLMQSQEQIEIGNQQYADNINNSQSDGFIDSLGQTLLAKGSGIELGKLLGESDDERKKREEEEEKRRKEEEAAGKDASGDFDGLDLGNFG